MRNIRKRASRPAAGDGALRLEESAAYELGRTFRRLNRAFSAALRPHGLSAVQANILITLWQGGPRTIGALQKYVAQSSSTLTGTIDRMERAELVRRVPAPRDRRSILIEPADWPAARRAEVVETLLATEKTFFGALDDGERKRLLTLLQKVDPGD